ncbi:MAG TPA: LapD/MoxY N-terminal periplasmic domain-containing protein [Candidimonas sp.]|nr:LapD/MoxY N-terminal periplasmic domain-containing protein [Candidimonas sp.]
MSLLKQLLLSVTIAIVCILAGTLAFSIDAARQYLDGQLRSESENAVSSLALSLSQPGSQDETTRELLMMALYDSGHFRGIRMDDPDGAVLFERERQAARDTKTAPDWFNRLLPLSAPTAVRDVSDGWRQLGKVSLTVDNAYAQDALWESSVRVLLLVVGAGIVWGLFALLLVRWLKRALRDEIAEQVRAIADGDEPLVPRRARVAELASVSRVISDVRERVRADAQEQSGRIESLQVEVNQDPVTGLANRKYFLNELRRELAQPTAQLDYGVPGGHVLIFRQRDLASINVSMSRNDADEWLRSVAQRVMQVVDALSVPRPQVARLNGSDFSILMPGLSGPQATRFVQRIRQVLQPLRVTVKKGQLCRWAFALTDYTADCDVARLLARLDHGLMCAESAGHGDIEYVPIGHADSLRGGTSETAWRSLLAGALDGNRLALAVRSLVYEGTTLERRHEASLCLLDTDGTELPAAAFMPAAVRLDLSADCDLRAIALGLKWLGDNKGDLVVMISLPSLLMPKFLPEMNCLLQAAAQTSGPLRRMVLEIDAHGLVAFGTEVEVFCRQAVGAGVRVGLRRLAQQPAAIMHLHRMPLDYVKLGGDFLDSLDAGPGGAQLLIAIATTARLLDMKVYADAVQAPNVGVLLREHGVLVAVDEQV